MVTKQEFIEMYRSAAQQAGSSVTKKKIEEDYEHFHVLQDRLGEGVPEFKYESNGKITVYYS